MEGGIDSKATIRCGSTDIALISYELVSYVGMGYKAT